MHCRDEDPFLRTHLDPSLIVAVGRSQLPQLTACFGGVVPRDDWFQLLLSCELCFFSRWLG